MPANKKSYARNLIGSMGDLARTEFWSVLPVFGFDALALWGQGLDRVFATMLMAGFITVFGEGILHSNDRQQLVSRFISKFLPDTIQRPFQVILEELIEEGAKREDQFSGTRDENKIKARQLLQDALRSASGKLGYQMPPNVPNQPPAVGTPAVVVVPTASIPAGAIPAGAPAAQVATNRAVPAAIAAIVPVANAPHGSQDSDKTIAQMVGEMSLGDQHKFLFLVKEARRSLGRANSPPVTEEHFERRLVRTSIPRAELQLFINAVHGRPGQGGVVGTYRVDDQSRDLFIRAVSQAVNAGGIHGRIERLLGEGGDKTADDLGHEIENVRTDVRAATAKLRRFE